jgi:hypothetical protein
MLLTVMPLFVCLAGDALLLSAAPGWWTTTVGGSLLRSNGKPDPAGKVYFANRVTGDIFLAPADTQGTFSVDLSPGPYDMRSRQGDVPGPGPYCLTQRSRDGRHAANFKRTSTEKESAS